MNSSLWGGTHRRWRCAVGDGIYYHRFEELETDDPGIEVRLCLSCGLRIEFHDDDLYEPRYIWYELHAADGTVLKSEVSHEEAHRELVRYMGLLSETGGLCF